MIRTVGGSDSPTAVSRILQDDTGHCVEVAARIHPGWSVGDKPLLDFVLRDLGQAAPEPDAEFWTQRDYEQVSKANVDAPPPEALSLNVNAFEAIVKAGGGIPGVAEVVTEPQATLATDLSKAVAALSEVEGLGEKEVTP